VIGTSLVVLEGAVYVVVRESAGQWAHQRFIRWNGLLGGAS
jgi:hypothetical protein